MATNVRIPVNGVIDYSDMNSGIDLNLEADPRVNGRVAAITKVIGSSYDDVIHGSAVSGQTLVGGDGNDTMIGVGFHTTFNGGAGSDTVDYSHSFDPVTADLSIGFAENGDAFVGIENLIGGVSNNTLIGDDASNRLIGGDMGDLLDGRGGADYMAGGKGNDVYYVDNAGDTVVEAANGGANDKVFSTVSYKLSDNVETLQLKGAADIDGTGNASANYLYGNVGNNSLSGGDGNDHIRGNGGQDVLTGGAGKDVFEFMAASDSTVSAMDHITDFTRGQDRLSLKGIDSNTHTTTDDAFKFIGTADFSHKAGELRYETHDSYTLVQGDTNGDGIADFAISLDHYTGTLKSADFVL